jgi:hypothetical protein
MDIDFNSSNVIAIVSAMFDLIENEGFTPDEVISLVDKIKEQTYEELVEVHNNR